jgi:hypothetical protein
VGGTGTGVGVATGDSTVGVGVRTGERSVDVGVAMGEDEVGVGHPANVSVGATVRVAVGRGLSGG